ncbi:MAG TPA: M28 family peptidase [Xanthomonadales bacterium]|nr:M28 family peptidase [Xanthomonadales bacterium]
MKFLRTPLFLSLACLVLGWGVYAGSQPPKPRSQKAPQSVFSAGRAMLILQELYAGLPPHVSGSAENALLRDRIISVFDGSGYAAEIQRRFHCKPDFSRCSPVENILAVHHSAAGENAILVTAHYDSSWAGPGVADDGAGVAAILEIARLAKLQPEFANDLMFLITDGEEQGLIGADAFVAHHEWFSRVRAVINLEARGVSGASVMFETGDNNRGVIRMLAKNLDHPVANSLAYEVYRRMPNDTDFTVYKAQGLPGVNFAFTGSAASYHSSMDDLERLDRGSLQHHGENAWSMLLALDERDLDRLPSSEDAAYIDLFGQRLLHYPLSSAMGLALVLGILALVAIRRAFHRQVVFRQVLWVVLSVLLMALAFPLAGWLLSWPMGRWVDSHPLEHPFPWLGRTVLLLAAVWIVCGVLRFIASRSSTGSVMTACWGVFALLAMGLALYLPVASYLAVLPLLGFVLGIALDGFRWKESPRLVFAALFGFLAALYIGLYFFFQLDVVLNFNHSQIKVIPLLLPAIAALPLLAGYYESRESRNGFLLLLMLLILTVTAGQHLVPAYTLQTPRDMSLMYRQDSGQVSGWLVLESLMGEPDAGFADKQGFKPVLLDAANGEKRIFLARETAPLDLPEIRQIGRIETAAEIADESRGYILELEIPADVRQLALRFPPGAGLLRALVKGQLAFDSNLQTHRSWPNQGVVINHPPPGRTRFEFEFAGKVPVEMTLTARFDLPAAVLEPYLQDWPGNAKPAYLGPRALKSWKFTFGEDLQETATRKVAPQANTR